VPALCIRVKLLNDAVSVVDSVCAGGRGCRLPLSLLVDLCADAGAGDGREEEDDYDEQQEEAEAENDAEPEHERLRGVIGAGGAERGHVWKKGSEIGRWHCVSASKFLYVSYNHFLRHDFLKRLLHG
jgi:hypothetical protein